MGRKERKSDGNKGRRRKGYSDGKNNPKQSGHVPGDKYSDN